MDRTMRWPKKSGILRGRSVEKRRSLQTHTFPPADRNVHIITMVMKTQLINLKGILTTGRSH
jgi:hypothetical protein